MPAKRPSHRRGLRRFQPRLPNSACGTAIRHEQRRLPRQQNTETTLLRGYSVGSLLNNLEHFMEMSTNWHSARRDSKTRELSLNEPPAEHRVTIHLSRRIRAVNREEIASICRKAAIGSYAMIQRLEQDLRTKQQPAALCDSLVEARQFLARRDRNNYIDERTLDAGISCAVASVITAGAVVGSVLCDAHNLPAGTVIFGMIAAGLGIKAIQWGGSWCGWMVCAVRPVLTSPTNADARRFVQDIDMLSGGWHEYYNRRANARVLQQEIDVLQMQVRAQRTLGLEAGHLAVRAEVDAALSARDAKASHAPIAEIIAEYALPSDTSLEHLINGDDSQAVQQDPLGPD